MKNKAVVLGIALGVLALSSSASTGSVGAARSASMASDGIAPTVSEGPVCTADLLALTAGWQGATGSMLGGLVALNVGDAPCTLPRPFALAVAANDVPLEAVDQHWDDGTEPVSLMTGERAGLIMEWWNWCGERGVDGFSLQLELSPNDRQVVVPVLDGAHHPERTPPRCDNAGVDSFMRIGNWSKLQ